MERSLKPGKRRAHRALVELTEAAYAPIRSESAWLANLFEIATPLLDVGHGALAYFVDASNARIDGVIGDSRLASALVPMHRHTGAMGIDPFRIYYRPRATTLRQEFKAQAKDAVRQFLGPVGEVWGITGVDARGRGVVLTAPQGRRRGLPYGARAWTMAAVHLATALRLRRRRSGKPDAVLAPSGKLLHCEPSVEKQGKSLAAAVVSGVEARRAAWKVGDEAVLEAWKALAEGKWSIVDTVDTDGKRLLVAKRNEVQADIDSAVSLDTVERQVCAMTAAGHPQKLIAYELGIHSSSVARRLTSALLKLRLRSPAELTRHFGWLPR
jgi:DNA-binding CsgD family transcriptional regulator